MVVFPNYAPVMRVPSYTAIHFRKLKSLAPLAIVCLALVTVSTEQQFEFGRLRHQWERDFHWNNIRRLATEHLVEWICSITLVI